MIVVMKIYIWTRPSYFIFGTTAILSRGELSICYEAVAPHYSQIACQYPLFIGARSTKTTMATTDHTIAGENTDSAVCGGRRELSSTETMPPSFSYKYPRFDYQVCQGCSDRCLFEPCEGSCLRLTCTPPRPLLLLFPSSLYRCSIKSFVLSS